MKQNNIQIPKGYKNSSLGIIPNDWEVKRLGEVSKITSGSTPLRSTISYFRNGNIPWVKTTDLNNGYISKTEELITEKALKETSVRVLPKGTILVAMYGGFNQIGRTGLLAIDATINQALSALLLDYKRIDCCFVLNWLNSKVGLWKSFAASSRKDPNITSKDVGAFPILIPPLPQQQKIAEILGTWDEAIEKQSTLIDKLTERKHGLMQQLLTGKKRLAGFNEDWKISQAGTIFKNVSIKGNSNEQLLSATQDNGVIPREMLNARVTMPAGETNSFKLVEKGDFVISLRSFQGGIEYSYYRGIVSPAYTVLKPKTDVNKEYYKQYFKSDDFIGHLAVAVIGIRDGKQISYNDFCFIKIPNPSFAEQTFIANILTAADKEIELCASL